MGTISDLTERLRRRCRPVIVVTAHGFAVGDAVFAWQAVSEIRGWEAGGTFLEFAAGGAVVTVDAVQDGFEALEAAMIAVFPETAEWRCAVQPRGRSVLYRRR